MHRINHETADANHNGDGKAGFTAGSTASGIPTTRLTPEWCNALQEEIANTIEVAGLTLDPANNSQMAQAVQALASSYAFTGAWSDIAGKPTFAPVATSGAYGDLSGKPDLNAYLAKSEMQVAVQSETGNGGPDGSYVAFAGKALPGFGNTSTYDAYSDFNAPLAAWGWSFVKGMGNAPAHGGTQGGYRCRIATAVESGRYALELCLGRSQDGADPKTLWMRQMGGGIFSNWYKVSAGNADTVGGMSATQLRQMGRVKKWLHLEPVGNVIRDSYGISSITDHAVGAWTIRFSTYFTSTGYAPAAFSHGNAGYIECIGAEAEYGPYWGPDALRIAHKVTGQAAYIDGDHVTVSFVGNE